MSSFLGVWVGSRGAKMSKVTFQELRDRGCVNTLSQAEIAHSPELNCNNKFIILFTSLFFGVMNHGPQRNRSHATLDYRFTDHS